MKSNFSSSLVLFTALFFSSLTFSQDDLELPNIVPPSPTAYELGKYGQIPVGMFTGTPNVSIPLYNYKAGNLTVPISLSYNSNGIKVDQLPSNVGLGWSLNAGGVITRIVKDETDEENPTLFPEEEIHQAGVNSPMALDYFYLGGLGTIDTETDMFMYNFLGYSGKFVLDKNGEIVLVPKKDILIQGYQENGDTGFIITTSDGNRYIFLEKEQTITRSYGSGHDVPSLPATTSWYLSKIKHPNGDEIEFAYYGNGAYSYDVSRSESITVASPTNQFPCNGGISSSYSTRLTTMRMTITGKKLVEIKSNINSAGKVLFNTDFSNPDATISSGYKLVSKLEVRDGYNQQVENIDFSYLTTSNGRAFLEKVSFLDPDKEYILGYIDPNGLVERLSKAQDHWGYYNGKTNNSHYFPNPQSIPFVPSVLSNHNVGADKSVSPAYAQKGLLNKIYYPTKGHSEFIYEANSFSGEEEIFPDPVTLNVSTHTGFEEMGEAFSVSQTTSQIPYSHMAEFYAGAYFNDYECLGGDDTGHHTSAVITIKDDLGNSAQIFAQNGTYIGTSLNQSSTSSNNYYYVNLEAGRSYTIKIRPMFECVSAVVSFIYHNQEPYTVDTDILSGGMRIHTVKSYTSDNSTPEITRYYYGKKESLNQSSGIKGKPAYYLSNRTNRVPCDIPCSYDDVFYKSLNSSSLRPLFNSSSNGTTYYKYVTVSNGGNNFENGGEENEFIIHNDYPGNPLKGDPIESSTWVNAGWSNGMLKKNTVFKKDASGDFVSLKETINNYVEDNRYFKKVYGYTIQKKFEIACTGDVTYECTASDITKQWEERYCQAEHDHWYLFISSRNCIASGNDNVSVWRNHPCYQKEVGDIITYPEYLENLDIMEYSTNSYWYYLNQSIEKVFDKNGENPIETTTNYYYDNPDHLQVTRTDVLDSKGDLLKTEVYYPDDVDSISSLENDDLSTSELEAINRLKSPSDTNPEGLHRISEPIQTVTILSNLNGTVLSKNTKRTNYKIENNLVLPEAIQTLKDDHSNDNILTDRVIFHEYDTNGNPLEVSKADGTHIVYIWGYNKQFPIAKIENATYSNVQSHISVLQTLSNADDDNCMNGEGCSEEQLRNGLNALREDASLSKAMITTYTYDPLIGVTSITDPRGNVVYYEYDAFNRLRHVRDKDGNILSKNEYNYANQN